jgi:hypothetical protein
MHAMHDGNRFASGNKGGCVVPVRGAEGEKQNLASVKLLETLTGPSETGKFEAGHATGGNIDG